MGTVLTLPGEHDARSDTKVNMRRNKTGGHQIPEMTSSKTPHKNGKRKRCVNDFTIYGQLRLLP